MTKRQGNSVSGSESNHDLDEVKRNLIEQFDQEDTNFAPDLAPDKAQADVVTTVVTAEALFQRCNKLDSAEKHDSGGEADTSQLVKKKKKAEQNAKTVQEATDTARELIRRKDCCVCDMAQTVALTAPLKRTVWET
jgi:hypothetical protein